MWHGTRWQSYVDRAFTFSCPVFEKCHMGSLEDNVLMIHIYRIILGNDVGWFMITGSSIYFKYCRTRNFRVCLYIAYLASGAASLYIKTL